MIIKKYSRFNLDKKSLSLSNVFSFKRSTEFFKTPKFSQLLPFLKRTKGLCLFKNEGRGNKVTPSLVGARAQVYSGLLPQGTKGAKANRLSLTPYAQFLNTTFYFRKNYDLLKKNIKSNIICAVPKKNTLFSLSPFTAGTGLGVLISNCKTLRTAKKQGLFYNYTKFKSQTIITYAIKQPYLKKQHYTFFNFKRSLYSQNPNLLDKQNLFLLSTRKYGWSLLPTFFLINQLRWEYFKPSTNSSFIGIPTKKFDQNFIFNEKVLWTLSFLPFFGCLGLCFPFYKNTEMLDAKGVTENFCATGTTSPNLFMTSWETLNYYFYNNTYLNKGINFVKKISYYSDNILVHLKPSFLCKQDDIYNIYFPEKGAKAKTQKEIIKNYQTLWENITMSTSLYNFKKSFELDYRNNKTNNHKNTKQQDTNYFNSITDSKLTSEQKSFLEDAFSNIDLFCNLNHFSSNKLLKWYKFNNKFINPIGIEGVNLNNQLSDSKVIEGVLSNLNFDFSVKLLPSYNYNLLNIFLSKSKNLQNNVLGGIDSEKRTSSSFGTSFGLSEIVLPIGDAEHQAALKIKKGIKDKFAQNTLNIQKMTKENKNTNIKNNKLNLRKYSNILLNSLVKIDRFGNTGGNKMVGVVTRNHSKNTKLLINQIAGNLNLSQNIDEALLGNVVPPALTKAADGQRQISLKRNNFLFNDLLEQPIQSFQKSKIIYETLDNTLIFLNFYLTGNEVTPHLAFSVNKLFINNINSLTKLKWKSYKTIIIKKYKKTSPVIMSGYLFPDYKSFNSKKSGFLTPEPYSEILLNKNGQILKSNGSNTILNYTVNANSNTSSTLLKNLNNFVYIPVPPNANKVDPRKLLLLNLSESFVKNSQNSPSKYNHNISNEKSKGLVNFEKLFSSENTNFEVKSKDLKLLTNEFVQIKQQNSNTTTPKITKKDKKSSKLRDLFYTKMLLLVKKHRTTKGSFLKGKDLIEKPLLSKKFLKFKYGRFINNKNFSSSNKNNGGVVENTGLFNSHTNLITSDQGATKKNYISPFFNQTIENFINNTKNNMIKQKRKASLILNKEVSSSKEKITSSFISNVYNYRVKKRKNTKLIRELINLKVIPNSSFFWKYWTNSYAFSGVTISLPGILSNNINKLSHNLNKINPLITNQNIVKGTNKNLVLYKWHSKKKEGFFYKTINKMNFLSREGALTSNTNKTTSDPLVQMLWELRTNAKLKGFEFLQTTKYYQGKQAKKRFSESDLNKNPNTENVPLNKIIRALAKRKKNSIKVRFETLASWLRDTLYFKKMIRSFNFSNKRKRPNEVLTKLQSSQLYEQTKLKLCPLFLLPNKYNILINNLKNNTFNKTIGIEGDLYQNIFKENLGILKGRDGMDIKKFDLFKKSQIVNKLNFLPSNNYSIQNNNNKTNNKTKIDFVSLKKDENSSTVLRTKELGPKLKARNYSLTIALARAQALNRDKRIKTIIPQFFSKILFYKNLTAPEYNTVTNKLVLKNREFISDADAEQTNYLNSLKLNFGIINTETENMLTNTIKTYLNLNKYKTFEKKGGSYDLPSSLGTDSSLIFNFFNPFFNKVSPKKEEAQFAETNRKKEENRLLGDQTLFGPNKITNSFIKPLSPGGKEGVRTSALLPKRLITINTLLNNNYFQRIKKAENLNFNINKEKNKTDFMNLPKVLKVILIKNGPGFIEASNVSFNNSYFLRNNLKPLPSSEPGRNPSRFKNETGQRQNWKDILLLIKGQKQNKINNSRFSLNNYNVKGKPVFFNIYKNRDNNFKVSLPFLMQFRNLSATLSIWREKFQISRDYLLLLGYFYLDNISALINTFFYQIKTEFYFNFNDLKIKAIKESQLLTLPNWSFRILNHLQSFHPIVYSEIFLNKESKLHPNWIKFETLRKSALNYTNTQNLSNKMLGPEELSKTNLLDFYKTNDNEANKLMLMPDGLSLTPEKVALTNSSALLYSEENNKKLGANPLEFLKNQHGQIIDIKPLPSIFKNETRQSYNSFNQEKNYLVHSDWTDFLFLIQKELQNNLFQTKAVIKHHKTKRLKLLKLMKKQHFFTNLKLQKIFRLLKNVYNPIYNYKKLNLEKDKTLRSSKQGFLPRFFFVRKPGTLSARSIAPKNDYSFKSDLHYTNFLSKHPVLSNAPAMGVYKLINSVLNYVTFNIFILLFHIFAISILFTTFKTSVQLFLKWTIVFCSLIFKHFQILIYGLQRVFKSIFQSKNLFSGLSPVLHSLYSKNNLFAPLYNYPQNFRNFLNPFILNSPLSLFTPSLFFNFTKNNISNKAKNYDPLGKLFLLNPALFFIWAKTTNDRPFLKPTKYWGFSYQNLNFLLWFGKKAPKKEGEAPGKNNKFALNFGVDLISYLFKELEIYKNSYYFFLKKNPLIDRALPGKTDTLSMLDYETDQKMKNLQIRLRKSAEINQKSRKKTENFLNSLAQEPLPSSGQREKGSFLGKSSSPNNKNKSSVLDKKIYITKLHFLKSFLSFFALACLISRNLRLHKKFRESLLVFNQPLIAFGPLGIIFGPFISKTFALEFDRPNNKSFGVKMAAQLIHKNNLNALKNKEIDLTRNKIGGETPKEFYIFSSRPSADWRLYNSENPLNGNLLIEKKYLFNYLKSIEKYISLFKNSLSSNLNQTGIDKINLPTSLISKPRVNSGQGPLRSSKQGPLPSSRFTSLPRVNSGQGQTLINFQNSNFPELKFKNASAYDPKTRFYKFFADFNTKLQDVGGFRYNTELHQALGDKIIGVYSGIFSKQPAKNILLVLNDNLSYSNTSQLLGNRKRLINSPHFSTSFSNILIQAIAGETGLKLFMEDAKRLRNLINTKKNSIRRLEKLFQIAQAHNPCLVLIEDIDVIASRNLNKNQFSNNSESGADEDSSGISYFKKFNRIKQAKIAFSESNFLSVNNGQTLFKNEKGQRQNTKETLISSVKDAINQEAPWTHIPIDLIRSIHPLTYSIRARILTKTLRMVSNIGNRSRQIKQLQLLFENGITGANYGGFIVFATTTRPSLIDPSLRAPGRLEETVYLPSENVLTRLDILKKTGPFSKLNTSLKNKDQNYNNLYLNAKKSNKPVSLENSHLQMKTALICPAPGTSTVNYLDNILAFSNYNFKLDKKKSLDLIKPITTRSNFLIGINKKTILLNLSLAYRQSAFFIFTYKLEPKLKNVLLNPTFPSKKLSFLYKINVNNLKLNHIGFNLLNRGKGQSHFLSFVFAEKIGEFWINNKLPLKTLFSNSSNSYSKLSLNGNNLAGSSNINILNNVKRNTVNSKAKTIYKNSSTGLFFEPSQSLSLPNLSDNHILSSFSTLRRLFSQLKITSSLQFYLQQDLNSDILKEYLKQNAHIDRLENSNLSKTNISNSVVKIKNLLSKKDSQKQKHLLNLEMKPFRREQNINFSSSSKFKDWKEIDTATSINNYLSKISQKQRLRKNSYKWWNWHLKKASNPVFLEEFQYLENFPYAEKYYNPRQRRWVCTNGYWGYGLEYEKTNNSEILEKLKYDVLFYKVWNHLDSQRESLDFLASFLLHKNILTEIHVITILKRFFIS